MTLVLGTSCDGCGGLDLAVYGQELSINNLPRNGWMSINVHDESGGVEGSEMHVCSVPCLEKLAEELMKNAPEEDEENDIKNFENRPHFHTH